MELIILLTNLDRKKIIDVLKNSDLSSLLQKKKKRILSISKFLIQNNDLSLVKQLLEKKIIDVNNTEYDYRWKPLHIASMANKPEMIKFLVSYGADLEAKDDMKYTALQRAKQFNKEEAIKTLIALGAKE